MDFIDLEVFWGRKIGGLWQPVGRNRTPTRKLWILESSKEQGARSKGQGTRSKAGSELPGLICIGFHRFSMDFIDFR